MDTEHRRTLLIQAIDAEHLALHDPTAGRAAAQTIAASARSSRNWLALGTAQCVIAWASRELYEHGAALTAIARAWQAAQRSNDAKLQAKTLTTRAMIRLELGQTRLARADIGRATALGGTDAATRFAASVVLDHCGDDREATRILTDLVAQSADGDEIVLLKALNNLGVRLANTDPDAGIAHLERAARLAEGSRSHVGAIARHNLGSVHARAGHLPTALAQFHEAEEMLRQAGAPLAEHLLGMAEVFGELSLLVEARQAATRALRALDVRGGELVRADALLLAAELAARDDDLPAATRLLAEADTGFARQRRHYGRQIVTLRRAAIDLAGGTVQIGRLDALGRAISALDRLGHVRHVRPARVLQGRYALALDRPRAAVRAWQAIPPAPNALDDVHRLLGLALASSQLGDRGAMRRNAKAGMRNVDSVLSHAVAPELRHRLGGPRAIFERIGRDALHPGPKRALDQILRYRSPAAASPVSAFERDPDLDEWRALQQRLDQISDDPGVELDLARRLAALERHMRVRQWGTASSAGPSPSSGLEPLLQWLDGRVGAILAVVGDHLHLFVVEADSVKRHLLGPVEPARSRLVSITRAMSALGAGDSHRRGRAQAAVTAGLSALDPLLSVLTAEELVLLVDPELESSVWASLPSLRTRSVTIGPLAVRRGPQCSTTDGRPVLAYGPGLASGADEIARVAAIWGQATIVDGTATAVISAVRTASVVHLACHGRFRSDNPMLSTLELADGPLPLGDLVATGAAPDVLYLSACSLGARADIATRPFGPVAGLLQAGVGHIVASAFPVPDERAEVLAQAVHRALCGGSSPATGLAIGRRELDPEDPRDLLTMCGLAAWTAAP